MEINIGRLSISVDWSSGWNQVLLGINTFRHECSCCGTVKNVLHIGLVFVMIQVDYLLTNKEQ